MIHNVSKKILSEKAVTIIFRKLAALLLSVAMLFGGFVPAASAHGLGQFIWWDDQGETFHTFGANTNITINTGKMQIIPSCSEGSPDGITSWSDLYIVPTGSVTYDGQELEDVSGKPNTVMGLSSGIFISETIGYTGPDGNIPPGTYDIVFDECQDGKYNLLYDGIIDPAFEVKYTSGVVPPLDLTKLKEDAEKEAKRWENYKKYADELFKIQRFVDAKNPNEKMVDFLMRSGLQDPRDAALLQLANQAKHYEGIAADPPDADYKHATPLGDRPILDFQSSDPLDSAIQAVANEVANEQAITQQLWTLLERYQGAQAAGNVDWALTHAKALDSNLNLLLAQLQRTSQSVSRMNQALAADSRPLTQIAADMEQLRSRIAASGFTVDETRYLLSLGFSDAQIAQFKKDLVAQIFTFTKNDMFALQSGIIDDNNVFGQDLIAFGSNIVDAINTLLQDPTVFDDHPIAKAGGPYSGNEGEAITFNGSASNSPAGIAKFEWDLNGNGAFEDAQGAGASHAYMKPFHGLIGLKVTDGAGNEAVDYAAVDVANVNRPAVVSASVPVGRHAELHAGESATFGVTAADPDNDPVSTQWYVDGHSEGTGISFTYSPSKADAGIHRVEAVVSDSNPLGGSARVAWTVQVLKPLPASIALSPGAKSLRVGETHSLQAKVLDDQGQAVSGLAVSLVITGANATALTATTDSNGIASFAYTGSQPGDDQATAQAALLMSNTADIHWNTSDTMPPVTTASLSPSVPDGSGGNYASPVTVTLGATDNDSGVAKTEYSVNSGIWKTYSSPFSFGTDGTYTVEFRSTDNAGNEEGNKSVQFAIALPVVILDTAAPTTTAAIDPLSADGSNGWHVSPVTVTLTATDDKSGVDSTQFSLDGAPWADYSAPVVVSSDGVHSFEFRSTDFAGNVEATKAVSFKIDTAKPNLTATVDPSASDGVNGWYVTAVNVTLATTDGGSGLAKTEYRINAGSWTDYTDPIAVASDGQYAIEARSVDTAGNASDTVTKSVKLDRVKPVTTASLNPAAPNGTGGSYASDVTVTLTATDGGSGTARTEYRTDNGAWQTYSGTPIVVSAAGTHTFDYRSADQAGNVEDVKSVSFTIDKSKAPQVFFNPEAGGRNVALLESGATVLSSSGSYDGYHTPQAMLDYSTAPYYPWATSGTTGQYVKFALAGSKTYLIDKVQIMPRIEYAEQRVKDFEIAVSTTTTDNAAFTTVLTATAANNGTLQDFQLPEPVMAKYIMYRPLTRQSTGGTCCISTQQLKINTGQEGGATVHFQNLSTADTGSSIVSWNWDFGDGSNSTEQSPTHTYSGPGTYTVTLTATDSSGKTGSYSLSQTVNALPAVDFSFTPGTPNEGQSVAFTDTTAVPNGGRIVQRTWNWGDGSAVNVRDGLTTSIAHTYRDNGSYKVTLQIIDDRGQTAQIQKTVAVGNLPPTAAIANKRWVKSGQSTTFSPDIRDAGFDSYTCRWDFGDGTSSSACVPNHTYPTVASGAPDVTYIANLTVTDKDGGAVTALVEATVYSPYVNPGTAIKDGDLFYSRYCTQPNVRKLVFNYDGLNSFALSTPLTVAQTGYADGLIFAPDGDLLVGGGSNVYKVNPNTGTFVTKPSSATAYHLMLDKSGKKLWAAGIPGWLVEFPLDPNLGNPISHNISGDETGVTSVSFDSQGTAYYTSSGAGGYGNFGTIDLTTFKTTRLLTNVPAAHGMYFDNYTGHLIMNGSNQVLQYDPVARKVVSIFTSSISSQFDQGAADGKGHILVASNLGELLFIDYSVSKEVGNPHNFVTQPYVESCLDDVAPLSGFGSSPPATVGLIPSAAALEIGQTHSLSALVTDAKGNTMSGTPVTLTITGANPGTLTAVTNASGIASFSYKGINAGDDTIVAKAGTISSGSATVKWSVPPASIGLTPSSVALKIGQSHVLSALVTDAGGNAMAGIEVNLTITGANPGTLAAVTNASGVASFFYVGSNAGDDIAVAKVGTISSGTATVKWSVPPAAIGLTPSSTTLTVGQTHSLSALVTDAGGNTMAGTSVNLTITGANPGTLTAVTNSSGIASFSYQGIHAGDDTAIARVEAVPTLISNPAAVKWKLGDTVPPVTTAVASAVYAPSTPNGWYLSDITLTLTATDDSSGIKLTEFRINGGDWSVYSGLIPLTQNGIFTYEFRSTDNAGNVEEPKSIVLKLDKTAPATKYHFDPIYDKDKSGRQYIKGYTTTLRATDNVSGSGGTITLYRINGGAWTPYAGSFTVYAGITHTVEYYSTDSAGNVESPVNKMDFDKGTFSGAGKF